MDRRESINAGIPFALTAASSGAAEAAPTSKPPLFPDNAQFWYETRRVFGAADYGGSEFGEVLVAAGRITSGDFDSWYEAWNDSSERIAKEAADQVMPLFGIGLDQRARKKIGVLLVIAFHDGRIGGRDKGFQRLNDLVLL
jgi:hypothetical protein